ncbi:MAG: kelch repeat-containing protein [Bacteroidota bacterium]
MKKILIILSLFILIVLSGSLSSCNNQEKLTDEQNTNDSIPGSNDSIPYCWQQLADLITPRNAHIAVLLDNKIYVAGGNTSGTSFEQYDISTNSWKSLSDMPTSREFIAGCVMDGKIYVIGGWMDNKTFDIVEEYDPVNNRWTTKSPMPTRRWGHSSIALDGKIYVLGGALDWPVSKDYSSIEKYDPQSDSWTTIEYNGDNDYVKRWGGATCLFNEKIYIIGGIYTPEPPDSGQFFNSLSIVEEYDPRMNTWKQKAPMPTPRWGLTAAIANNKIYVIGGGDVYQPQNILTNVEAYDPLTDAWTSKPDIPKGQIVAAACAFDNRIYVLGGGGLNPYDAYTDLFVYTTICDTLK